MKLQRRSYEDKQRMMAYNLFRRREEQGRLIRLKAIAGYMFFLGATITAIVAMLLLIWNGGR